MSDNFLELNHLTKRYDEHIAVNDVSMQVPRGRIYGLLGPNGAGKTSTIRMITQITIPDEGEIIFDGHPMRPDDVNNIGYMPEERGLYKKMKVKDQVDYLLSLKGLSRSEARRRRIAWLERLGLSDWTDRKTTDLSKGMQQKVQFISTIAHEPPLLILDEPFSGLDPVNAQLMEDVLMELKEKGTTIIFSTHRMEQVEDLCDSIGLISRGRLILEDEINTVRKRFQRGLWNVDFVGDKSVLAGLSGISVIESTDRSALIQLDEGEDGKSLMQKLVNTPLELLKVELHLPRLQEIFIELVGKDAAVAAQVK
jgi:ABC-2 type transport system ATP-binding protein